MTLIRVPAFVTPIPRLAPVIANSAGRRPSEPPTPCSDPHALHCAQDWGCPGQGADWRRLSDRARGCSGSILFGGDRVLMIATLKLVALSLVVATMNPSVAHARELPGKLRLTHEQYLAVQPIYDIGFTIIGAAEPLSVLILAALLAVAPGGAASFWLITAALAPVNKVWLRTEALSGSAQRFFGVGGL